MAIDVGGAPPVSRRSAQGQWPLAGRSRELQQLREAIRARRGAVLEGPAGSGKTVLAHAGIEFAQDQGMSVALLAGTDAAQPYPFGAFAALLPPGLAAVGPDSQADLLRYYARELVDSAGGRPLLLVVDDAHLLDNGSSMLVHQLSLTATATILACVLTATPPAHPLSDPAVALWKDHDAARIELAPLGDESIEELLHAVLGGPVDAASLRQIADHTLGDPLYLRELVTGALESHALSDESGVWRLRAPLQPTSRLTELVNLRLGHLSDAERHVLELTAIGEPLAQPTLDQLTERFAVESLEDKGFLASRLDGRRLQVCLSHPVLTDVVRAGVTPRRERALAAHAGRGVGGPPPRRHAADGLVAPRRGRRQCGAPLRRRESGARPARLRAHGTAGPRRHRADGPGQAFEARLLAAESAHVQGRHVDAEHELDALGADAATPTERIRVALLRFDLAYFSRGSADVSVIDSLLKTAVDPAWRGELLARRLCMNGASRGARAVVETVPVPLGQGASTPRSSLHSVVGGFLAAQRTARRGTRASSRFRGASPASPST